MQELYCLSAVPQIWKLLHDKLSLGSESTVEAVFLDESHFLWIKNFPRLIIVCSKK